MLINRENEPAVGCWNAIVLSFLGFFVLYAAFQIGRWAEHRNEPKPVAMVSPMTGEPLEVSAEPRECLILVRGENNEPDYVLGRGEECDQ